VAQSSDFYKKRKKDLIYWKDNLDKIGVFEFSFDKETVYNLFRDYPQALTPRQKEIFDKENPFWARFFNGKKGANPGD